MADSNITKRALAAALRKLMEETPFEKINVASICERCNMSRKSFYYHFKDKYDLVNWIFDMEFFAIIQDSLGEDDFEKRIETLQVVCDLFYKNRNFYRKALKIEGQNSFEDYLRRRLLPVIKLRLEYLLGEENADDFNVNFFADAVLGAIERWISDHDCMPPDQFVSKLKLLILGGAEAIHHKFNQEEAR